MPHIWIDNHYYMRLVPGPKGKRIRFRGKALFSGCHAVVKSMIMSADPIGRFLVKTGLGCAAVPAAKAVESETTAIPNPGRHGAGSPRQKYPKGTAGIRMAALILVMLVSPLPRSGEPEDRLESVLKRLERASREFESFAADITATRYTAVLDRFEPPEKGKFFYRRANNGSALIRWEISNPGIKILTIENDEAIMYQPKIRSARRYKLGKNKDKAEYLALGIGQSPGDLKKTFNIAYRGSENVRGFPCSILLLKPKGSRADAMFSSITVWIKDSTGISTRIKLEERFQDHLLVDFSNEQLNRKMDDSMFRQQLPANVDVLQIY